MGRKTNTKPVEGLNLLNDSQVHWENYSTTAIGHSVAFRVTCGMCHRDRWVTRISMLHIQTFTGLCRSCCHKIMTPPPAKPGYKRGYTRTVTSEGYITLVIASLPKSDQLLCVGMEQKHGGSGRVLEHRLVMARSLNKPLEKNEVVHHKNGDKTDNRIENLELAAECHGKGVRQHDLIEENQRLRQLLDEHHISY